MSHEQSETIQDPRSGLFRNVFGRKTGKSGDLPRQRGTGRDRFESQREAETAAIYRSFNAERRQPKQNMPKGGSLSPTGDIGILRQKEARIVAPVFSKAGKDVKASDWL